MKNVLLLAMSTLPKDIKKENRYQYQNENGEVEVLTAISQLEPVTHMLNNELGKKGEKLDKIIILETEETRNGADGKPAAVAFYKQRVAMFAEEIKYDDILIDENQPAEGIRKATDRILLEYEDSINNKDEMKLWIDTQGGFRDIVVVFTAIISLLREQGIEAEKIYATRYNHKSGETGQKPHPIIDQTAKYDIFKFVSAMQEFMDFGKATGLKKYYGEKNGFVQAIDKIADAIQMCQPQMFEEALRGFKAYLDSGQYKNEDSYLQIFVSFIKKDYGALLDEPDDTIKQIEWCVRKEFYQQAMTIYIEKMPQYYYEKEKLNLEIDSKSSHGTNPYAAAFYTDLFGKMLEKTDDLFRDILLGLHKELNKGRNAVQYLRAESERTGNKIVRGAVRRLVEYIEDKYDENGALRSKELEGEPKNVKNYVNKLNSDSDRRGRNKFLYDCSLNDKENYTKKVFAVKAAKETDPQLANRMGHYLAIKLLRNRMNHASDTEGEGDEKKAIELLKTEGIDIGIEVIHGEPHLDNYKIKKLILDGLSCSKSTDQNSAEK